MFVKSNLLLALATSSRGYTGKTCLRGLIYLYLLFHYSTKVDFLTLREAATRRAFVVANYIRPKLFKHPLNNY